MPMTTVREIDESEKAYWNAEVQKFACAHPLNAYEWGMVRSVDGWTPIYLCAEREKKLVGAMMILMKRLPFTPFKILHSQKMPIWHLDDDETLAALVNGARQIAERENAIFIRVTPNIAEDSVRGRKDAFIALGFKHLEQRWSFWNSPRDVARVDLTSAASPEEIFSKLDRKTRASIRKAQASDTTVQAASTKAELREFYRAFQEFSTERGFMVRPYAYQEKLWDTYLMGGMGRLLVVKNQEMIVGGYLCLLFAGKCLFLHMGTPNRFRNLYSDDAGVWACIKWAKEQGCSWFSFRGVGTTSAQEAFKRKFNPKTVALVGYYDLSFKPLLYKMFYWCEFTLLPWSWPLIVRTRRLARVVIQAISGLTGASR
jgi:peptidoglycan pentaglycine glycine transferase (the first glycine)